MAESIDVPDNLRPFFDQVMKSAPEALCDDEKFQQAILVYLKLGGVKLARQHVQTLTVEFCKGFQLEQQSYDPDADEDDEDDSDGDGDDDDDETPAQEASEDDDLEDDDSEDDDLEDDDSKDDDSEDET